MLVCVRVCGWCVFLLGTAAVQTEFPKIGFINTSKTGAISKGGERDREAPRRLCSSLCRVLLTLVFPQFSSMIASIHDIWKPQVTHSSLERELWEVIHRYNINAKFIFVLPGVMHNFNLQKHQNKIDKLDKENVQIVRKKAKCGKALAVVTNCWSFRGISIKKHLFLRPKCKKEKKEVACLGANFHFNILVSTHGCGPLSASPGSAAEQHPCGFTA